MLPRAVPPDSVPLPAIDERELHRVERTDRARVQNALETPLSREVRALGSAIREFNLVEARGGDYGRVHGARGGVDEAFAAARASVGDEAIRKLRAVQLEGFLAEVRRYERTGDESEELLALGGPFVSRMRAAGWVRDKKVLLREDERRVAYKLAWNAVVAGAARRELALTLDEQRVLYTLYLRLPHAPEAVLRNLELARRGATNGKACGAIEASERAAVETWRLDKVKKLAQLDPTYPAAYARGVLLFRRGNYGAAAEAFREWVVQHPNGPLSVRAANFLRASVAAERSGP